MSAVSQRSAARVQPTADGSEGTRRENSTSLVCRLCLPRRALLLNHIVMCVCVGNAQEPIPLSEDTHVVRAGAFPVQPALRVGLGAWTAPSRSGRRSKVIRELAMVVTHPAHVSQRGVATSVATITMYVYVTRKDCTGGSACSSAPQTHLHAFEDERAHTVGLEEREE